MPSETHVAADLVEDTLSVPLLPKKDVVLQAPNGRRYQLLSRLGGGRFSEVWKAVALDGTGRQAAVKIMLPALDEQAQRLFAQEAYTLLALAKAEQSLGLRPESGSLVPEVEALADDHAPPFFVETLAPGRPLDQILREERRLAEATVLKIGEQLCRVLQALHEGEGLERSYLDFQPRNVFWEAGTQRLLVIDWNLLSQAGKADVAGDLGALVRLLYRLAVGQPPPESGLEHAPHDEWIALTPGTRSFFTRVLHQSPARRYPSAAEMRRGLQVLLGWWAKDAVGLLREVASRLEAISGESGASEKPWRYESDYRTLEAILGVAEAKGADTSLVQQLSARISEGLRESSALGQGRIFFQASDHALALEAFEEASEEASTLPEKLAAYRWRLLAKASLETHGIPSPSRDDLVRAVEALGAWTMAEWSGQVAELDTKPVQVLTEISEEIASPSLDQLYDEGDVWQALWLARAADQDTLEGCRSAAEEYQQAAELAQGLPNPYGELLRRLWGDLHGQGDRLRAKAGVMSAAQARVVAVRQAHERDPHQGLSALRDGLRHAPGDEALTDLSVELCRRTLETGQSYLVRVNIDALLADAAAHRWHELIELRSQALAALAVLQRLDWADEALGNMDKPGSTSISTARKRLPLFEPRPVHSNTAGATGSSDGLSLQGGPSSGAPAQDGWAAAWDGILDSLQRAALARGLVRDAVQHPAWDIVVRVLRSSALPAALKDPFLKIAESLARDSVQTGVLNAIRAEGARTLKRRHVESLLRSARSVAQEPSTLAQSEALRKIEQAQQESEGLDDRWLAQEVMEEQTKVKDTIRQLQREKVEGLIEPHWREARYLIDLGLLSGAPQALQELEKARRIAQQQGNSELAKKMSVEHTKYAQKVQHVESLLEKSDRCVSNGNYQDALELLRHLKEEYRFTGWVEPGEIDKYMARVAFREKQARFKRASKAWRKRDKQDMVKRLKMMHANMTEAEELARQIGEAVAEACRAMQKEYSMRYREYQELQASLERAGATR